MKRIASIDRIAAAALLAAALAFGAAGGPPSASAQGSGGGESLRPATTYQLADWDAIWSFIDEYYIYPDFRGVDWKAQKSEVAAKIRAGLDDAGFTALVDRTLALFKDPRTSFLSPERLRSQLAISGGEGTTGVGLFLIRGKGNYAVVASVVPGGSAAAAGIAAHDRILAIDGKPPLDAYGEPDLYRVRGPEGSVLRLRVSRAGGAAREVTLTRRPVAPEGGALSGRLLEETGGKRIGYLFIASLSLPDMGALLRAELEKLAAWGALDGLVLDLRAATGGLGEPLLSCAGAFVSGGIGTIVQRDGQAIPVEASGGPVANSHDIPMVVLVGKATRSGAEMLAGALKLKGRARLVGGLTAGDTAIPAEADLPGGGVVAASAAKFAAPDGSDPGWLGRGVAPDAAVPLSGWDDIAGEADPALAKALELLLGK